MTSAADRWATLVDPVGSPSRNRRRRVGLVWRSELTKLMGLIRIRLVLVLCLLVPFVIDDVFIVQSGVPQDTLFGQWVHSSGWAISLVILGFAGQWVLPLLTSMVAGDIFSSEDQFGTWKTVLTRSRSRGEMFAGKVAAAVTYTVAAFLVLAISSSIAGRVMGAHPLVGLSGQLVAAGHAETLVWASWATQLAPMLGFCGLAVLLSIVSRNSAIGIGGPVLIGLLMQLLTLVDMPESVREALLATPFASWHTFWVQAPYYPPFWHGLTTSAVWFVVCVLVAWVIFRRRSVKIS